MVVGTTVTYSATVCNKGSVHLSTVDIELFYDRTTAPTCSSAHSQQWTQLGLGAGKCVTKNYTRAKASAGSYTAWVAVDADCKISETNENNNQASYKYSVSGSVLKPDLYIHSFTASVSGTTDLGQKPGCSSKYDFKWSVKGLVAGKCATVTHTRKATPNGSYVAWVLGDSSCSVSEGDETNNSYASVYKVALQPDTGVVLPDSGPQPDMPPPPPPDQFVNPDQPQPEEDGPPPVEPDGEAAAPDQGTPDQAVTTPDQGGPGEGGADEGCSCDMQRVPRSGNNGALLLLGLGLLLALRRRRE